MPFSGELRQPDGSQAGSRGVLVTDEQLNRLSASLAKQFLLLNGVGPDDPHVSFGGGVLTFAFQGGFTADDEYMLVRDPPEQFREFREHFLREVSEELNEVVEAILLATRVSFFFAAFESDSRTTSCFFVLDPVADSEREQREAILAWGEQVRRSARRLRSRTRDAREANLRLAQGLASLRRESDCG